MSSAFQLAGYDKHTERLSVSFPLPESLVAKARELADIGEKDDGGGIYPLAPAAAIALGFQTPGLDLDSFDWFLEPGA